jgi:CRISPR/Cas system-associated exonuclease Cas4 (RecB family)
MIIKPALRAHALRRNARVSKAQRATWPHYVGASEIGSCLRRIGYSKSLVPKGEESWGAAQRGATFEESFWVPAMRAHYGKNLLYAGKQQKSLLYGKLRATPDGLLIKQPRNALKLLGVPNIGKSGEIVLDCKTLDPRINLAVPKPEHEFQIQTQLALLRKTTKHRPDYGVLSYVNASFYDDVVEFAIKYDAKVFEQAKARAAAVMAAKQLGDLAPEGWIAGGHECEYCPFAEPCRALRGDVPVVNKLSPPNNINHGLLEKIIALAQEERRYHTIAGGAEDKQRKIQYEIKELLRAHGLNRIAHENIVIIWSPVKGRPALDMPALKLAAMKCGFDIQPFETVGQPTDRLVVTIKSQLPSPAKTNNPVVADTAN